MIRREIELFFNALRFFTRMPVPRWVGHSTELLNHSARYFPLVGWLVGLVGAAGFLIVGLALPVSLAIVLSMVATIRFTGAFHEDGFGDVCDGFGGGWDRAQVLSIMKDSRIGAYGAIGLALMLIAKFLALLEMGEELVPIALLAAHPLSRFASTTLIYALVYPREDQPDEIARAKPLAHRLSAGELGCAALFGCAPLLLLTGLEAIGVVVLVGVVTLWAARCFRRRIGGYTGDCLGATQQLAELAAYLALNFSWLLSEAEDLSNSI